jgi:hypothetical protein
VRDVDEAELRIVHRLVQRRIDERGERLQVVAGLLPGRDELGLVTGGHLKNVD